MSIVWPVSTKWANTELLMDLVTPLLSHAGWCSRFLSISVLRLSTSPHYLSRNAVRAGIPVHNSIIYEYYGCNVLIWIFASIPLKVKSLRKRFEVRINKTLGRRKTFHSNRPIWINSGVIVSLGSEVSDPISHHWVRKRSSKQMQTLVVHTWLVFESKYVCG